MARANLQRIIRACRTTGVVTKGTGLGTGAGPIESEGGNGSSPLGKPGSPYAWQADLGLQTDPMDPLQGKILSKVRHFRNKGVISCRSGKGGTADTLWPKAADAADVYQEYVANRLEKGLSYPSGVLGTDETSGGVPMPTGYYCDTHVHKGDRWTIAKTVRKEVRHTVGYQVKTEKRQAADHPCRRPYQRQTGTVCSWTSEYGTQEDKQRERDNDKERQEDLMQQIMRSVATMADADKAIIEGMLRGRTQTEIGADIGVKQPAVAKRWNRIREDLKAKLVA